MLSYCKEKSRKEAKPKFQIFYLKKDNKTEIIFHISAFFILITLFGRFQKMVRVIFGFPREIPENMVLRFLILN